MIEEFLKVWIKRVNLNFWKNYFNPSFCIIFNFCNKKIYRSIWIFFHKRNKLEMINVAEMIIKKHSWSLAIFRLSVKITQASNISLKASLELQEMNIKSLNIASTSNFLCIIIVLSIDRIIISISIEFSYLVFKERWI